jgi:hypothetical protein
MRVRLVSEEVQEKREQGAGVFVVEALDVWRGSHRFIFKTLPIASFV